MKTMKMEILILCFFVGMMASPAAAVTVLWQSANTDIDLSQPYGNLEFENPLAGTEMIKEYAIKEWRDADYSAGPPRWYDDWSVNDPIGIDGYANEIWMRTSGHSIWTTTTVASTVVSIHLHGDDNDGLADILVDGILVARLDMGTSPGTQNALIIVKNLAHITHHIRVTDLGIGPNTGGDDVATMGAAALEKRIKWSQPPKPAMPDNLYYGWNEISIYDSNQIVADDWQCDDDNPLTDIHWWGSFKGWNESDPPPADQSPTSFHITIWNDIPANPADTNSFSHPNEVVWEIDCTNFSTKFVGWDYDPRTNCFEACFYYEQDLTEAEYFYQRSNPDGTPSIYWISIAAQYPAGSTTENLWGWKTRRRDPHSPAPDDAVKIRKPTMPHIGDKYQEGKPIYWPDTTQSWDMAFELTAQTIIQGIKWEQKPEPDPTGGPCYYGWDEWSQYGRQQIVADDWACDTTEPVTDIHWWGSYIGWNDENPPADAPDRFHIAIWTDVPAGVDQPFSHPRTVVWEAVVPRSELNEKFDGCDSHPANPGFVDSCFYYEYIIPRSEWFYQDPVGQRTIYWLSISAVYTGDPQYRWGWKTRPRNPDSPAPDDAVRIFDPTAPALGLDYIAGEPIEWEGYSYDTAFMLTTQQVGPVYYKWRQPPEPYTPEAYDGWNELSVYYWNQIAADDWFCDTDDPVTDIHWWGSFLGWSCEGQPPQIPDSFHIAIWTDVPAIPGTSDFSHPGMVIWETNCNNFTSKFVGWDIDPRDPTAPPEACFKFEQDIPEEEWFEQKPGGNIYWISIAARYPTGTTPMYPWGWKTRRRDLNSRAPDDAVRIFNPTDPILGSMYLVGEPIFWPTPTMSWDLAFELTTKKKPPKKPVPHLKWSQPPIEVDPNSETPVYSGWDEKSYIDQIDTTRDPLVADDYRCLGNMPVTSIHWWGSHYGFVEPGATPPMKPIGWKIGFWTNVPAPDGEWDLGDPHKMHYPQLPDPNGWDLDITGMNMSADDWRCTKSGPVTDIHFWYSWLDDNVGTIEAIKVRIYDNVPEDPGDPTSFSHPGTVLWSEDFLPGEFTTRLWGKGNQGFITPPPTNPIPDDHNDIYQCNIINIPDPFYQNTGEIYWLAISIDVVGTANNRIGWKTSGSDQFLDDAVYLTPAVPVAWVPWTDPETGVSLDLAFVITGDVPYSHPEKMLWEVKVPEDRVEVEEVGTDFYHHYHPNDVTYQYTLYLEPEEFFWQGDYLEDTTDDIFWLSIAAIYSPDIADIQYPWGWKTRPWSWMDDAVRFTYGGSIEPGIVLDPIDITPIKDPIYQESFDVAFELDTDPNYIKWEQPFIGIRRWPHYEDETSMAREVTTTEHIVKWAQSPDTTETGVDVDATDDGTAASTQLLADDFPCDTTEPITNIHVYGSWLHDDLPNGDPAQVDFTLSIHKDIPADPLDPTSYSMPGDMLWSEDFAAGDFTIEPITAITQESYYIPCTNQYFPFNHTGIYKYNFYPKDPFVQQGSSDNPIIYWLDVQAKPISATAATRFGWKSRDLSEERFMDDAVWVVAREPYNGDEWQELRYPLEHPNGGQSMDLAFEITSDKVTTEFIIDRLVADDWRCDHNTPVTDAVWWGSYIGYRYKPCHGPIMQPPVKPDYFWLTIWTDIPAGVDPAVPFSHPNEIVWKYKAYDYDEVLVGYDKHPHDTPGDTRAREPVFRYSVRLPKENWFIQEQEDVNSIYWFSVVAVYEAGTDPLYDWGWTNHKHVFNDDAVAGWFDPAVGEWFWTELLDQLKMSEDMSFILFTEPDCLSRTAPEYSDWVAWNKPSCWCYSRQCRGDIDGLKFGPFWVQVLDLDLFKASFNKADALLPPGGVCADLDHLKFGPFRVQVLDLDIFKIYFNKGEALVPECDQIPIYTGPYNYWKKP